MLFSFPNNQKKKHSKNDISLNNVDKNPNLFTRNHRKIKSPRKILMFGIGVPKVHKVPKETKSPMINDLENVENKIIEKNDELVEEEYEDDSNVEYYEEESEEEHGEEEEEGEEEGDEEEGEEGEEEGHEEEDDLS